MANLPSLPDKAAVLERAATLGHPIVAFHTDGGSVRGRFILHNKDDHREVGQMTRATFNTLMLDGHLEVDLEKRYRMHDRCQAWPVILSTE
jgi:hypothetical protein